MTTQLRTIPPATEPPIVKPTKKAASESANQAADQFAAMLASLCFATVPQPQQTPDSKPQEAAPADITANLEVTGSDSIPAPPIPVITLQTVDLGMGKELPHVADKATSWPPLNMEPEPTPTLLPQLPAPSSHRQENLSSSPAAQITETISSPSMTVLPPSAPGPHTDAHLVDPTRAETEAGPPRFGSRSAAETPVAQDPRVIVNISLADQTLQTEAARRDANLVAGYLAKTARNDREGNAASGVKTLLAGNGFDLHGDDRKRDSDFDSRLQLPSLASDASFAATVRDLQANDGTGSIQAQTISQIIAQAETLPARQMRSLRLRLRPEELGQIDIQLTRDASGRISAHISAERESARGALSRTIDQLRETLSRAGLNVDKLQISADPGLFGGNRENNDARSNTRESPSVANVISANETEPGGQPPVDTEKLISLRA